MEKYKISKEEIKEICEGAEEIDHINTMAALKDFFSQKSTKGMWLKDIMVEMGIENGQIPPEKDKKIQWIMDHVKIPEIKTFPEILKKKKDTANEELETNAEMFSDAADIRIISRTDMNDFIGSLNKECFHTADDELDITKAEIYEGIPVEYQDNFCVKYSPGFYENLAVILKGFDNTVVAVGRLQRDKDKYHIILDRENIDYKAFGSNRKYRLGLFEKEAELVFKKEQLQKSDAIEFNGIISTVQCMIDYRPMDISNNALCIDFGTSNTSAGSYGIINPENNDIELVSFTDVTTPKMKEVKLYPTMVYVEDCADPNNIRYLFGYKAKKKVKDKGYDMEESVFFEIKRWMGSLDDMEEIKDEKGNSAMVKRREIIKAYILHIIDLSQQHFKMKFKKLHLSAPVRLKGKFYDEMNRMLSLEYIVLPPDRSVDEGIAIIYNSISKLVDQKEIREDETTSIMILDCGGGTTDLASCEVAAKDLTTGKKLEITTKFVNGNSNFGGNNITFRIMQLLKIKLAEKYNPEYMENCSLKELIPLEESQILSEIEAIYKEDKGKAYNSDTQNIIYEKFMNAYKKAEDVIPTIFSENKKFQFAGQLKKIKRNYYYLWQLAEKIKIKFYEEDVVSVEFQPNGNKPLDFDTIDNYYLYSINGDDLEKKENPADEIKITINEIRRVLCGDIYGLLNELLAQKDFKVDSYKYYRLAGQSCKINLFMELLKEFIPGRRLRTSSVIKREQGEEEVKGSIRLKLDCIKGSIAYIRDQECGKIKPEMQTDTPKLIYDVYINKVDVETKILSRENAEQVDYEVFSNKATKAELLVKNSFGEIERKIVVNFSSRKPDKIELSKLFADIEDKGIVTREALNKLKAKIGAINPRNSDENEYVRIVFAIPSKEGYGMNIYRIFKGIDKDKEIYGWWNPKYENYENESTKSFFDGKR